MANPPIKGQDDWLDEEAHYAAKDGELGMKIINLLAAGEYTIVEKLEGEGSMSVGVLVPLTISVLLDEETGEPIDESEAKEAAKPKYGTLVYQDKSQDIGVGQSVGQILAYMTPAWDISIDAEPYLHKTKVDANYVIQEGDVLTMYIPAGLKA